MKKRLRRRSTLRSTVKVGASRQVVIPKRIHDRLGLSPGDYLEVELRDDRVVFTPKVLVDRGIAEALADLKAGRVSRRFKTAKELIRALEASDR
ncbi:MAG TPA: AbrB/MazE/SpoVT family DNA-binding domain-containing protein [Planctomycetota bacterium]|jgi:AbrB family looped-hinge helix DNA binding protein|nr:AbrB/MazE/SpoVT family DNA-binding domain-containing protein [Planctomycetota bacterium]